jgi:very-short-patch-repair endonuclease
MQQREFARYLRRNMTDAEQVLWRHLRDRQLAGAKFRRQQAIGPYVVDFVDFETRLIIEADGGEHNGSASDLLRDEWFASQGFRILRFWNNQILQETAAVLERIRIELKAE